MINPNRRQFQRVPFIADVFVKQKQDRWKCHLQDISLKGILIDAPKIDSPNLNASYMIDLKLADGMIITLHGKITHQENGHWGLKWNIIDLDSFTLLRKLLELNQQDSSIIHKEVSELSCH